MAVALSNMGATWSANTGNTAIKMTISDSANSPNSNLITIIVNNDTIFNVDRFGNISANNINVTSLRSNTVITNQVTSNGAARFSPVAWILS